jgi:hypothetical protein
VAKTNENSLIFGTTGGAADVVVVAVDGSGASIARPYTVVDQQHVDAHLVDASVDRGSAASLMKEYESDHVLCQYDMRGPFLRKGIPMKASANGWGVVPVMIVVVVDLHWDDKQVEDPSFHNPLNENEHDAIPCGVLGSSLEAPFLTYPRKRCEHGRGSCAMASSLKVSRVN